MTTTSTPTLLIPPHVPMTLLSGTALLGGASACYRLGSVPKLLIGIGIGVASAKSIQDLKTPLDDDLRKGVFYSAMLAATLGFTFKKPKTPRLNSVGGTALMCLGYYLYSLKGFGPFRRHVVSASPK